MAPAHHHLYRKISPDYKTACVLALLFPIDKVWHIGLIERSIDHPDDKHAGQLSLPGGKMEKTDVSLEDCALRETYEEIGVHPNSIGILGSLTPLYVFVSNFKVYPFIGFTTEYPKFTLQKSEVSAFYEVPLDNFTNPTNKSKIDIPVRELILPDVPYYKVRDKILWGATAMIMSEIEHILTDFLE